MGDVTEFKDGDSISIGRMPIMVRSDYCYLNKKSSYQILEEGEC